MTFHLARLLDWKLHPKPHYNRTGNAWLPIARSKGVWVEDGLTKEVCR